MGAPISRDLRERIVEAWRREKLGPGALAKRFLVGVATVNRLVRRYRETGSVEARPYRDGRRRVIDERGEKTLRRLIEQHPDWTSYELADAYNERAKRRVNRSTVLRAIKRLGYTIKKSPLSPKSALPSTSSDGEKISLSEPPKSPLRIWFLWTRPAHTRQ